MQLKPLEFSDCLTDSPFFRQNLHQHEIALEQTSKKIKEVELQCRKILSYTNKLSQAQKHLADVLHDFKLGMVGTMSEDDLALANYTKELATLITMVEDQRSKTVQETEKLYISPLQILVEKINRVRDERQKYSKETSRFYQTLERNLNLKISTVRKSDLREADTQLALQQRNFCQASLYYVSEIQNVQECIRIEFVQTISSFLYQWLLFYHMANAIHQDFRATYNEINDKIQKAKDNLEVQQIEADELRRKMLVTFMQNTVFKSEVLTAADSSDVLNAAAAISTGNRGQGQIKQGYLYMHEKSLLPKTISRDVLSRSNWTKYYGVYSKETKIFTLIPGTNIVKTDMKGEWIGHTISFKKLDCCRKAPDSIDKRFCFEVVPENRTEVLTFQALSEIDCSQWLETMDSREVEYGAMAGASSSLAMLDDNGFDFIRNCIDVIEEKGISEQGIYRNCGVNSKVQKLIQTALDRRKCDKTNILDSEWEIKTISSAIKTFLRNLPEPLMTFEFHQNFINAAKLHDSMQRIQHIHYWVYKLPTPQKTMLDMIIRHLHKVAQHSAENLMSIGNLAVCFGPTLLRPREETVAAVLDIKFCNVVVEVLIENCQMIFGANPPQNMEPCPPKPAKNPLIPAIDERSFSSKDDLNSSLSDIHLDPQLKSSMNSSQDNMMSVVPMPIHSSVQKATSTTSRPGSTQNFGADTLRRQKFIAEGGIAKQFESRSEICLSDPGSNAEMRSPKRRMEIDSPASTSSSSIDRTVTTRAAKNSGQYAPSYNPSTMERSMDDRSGNAGLLSYSSIAETVAPMRIPSAYSNFINPNSPLHPPRRVRTLYPCNAGHVTELSFAAGQIITNVYESKEEGWLVGTLNGKTGLIPANYVSYVDNF